MKILTIFSSCFIASVFALEQARWLLAFDVTLHRLEFPSSDRYISECFSVFQAISD